MKIALCAGEVSGDLYGSLIAQRMLAESPAVRLIGLGGPKMLAAGVRPVAGIPFGTMGVTGVLLRMPAYAAALRRTAAILRRESPDLVVLIDNPGFNLRLAAAIGKKLPCCYYIPPKVWAHGYGRLRLMRRHVRSVIPIFPFEPEIYRKEGIRCAWFGHPIVDLIPPPGDPSAFRAACGLSGDERVVGLLPGSRAEEVERLAPAFLRVLGELRRREPGLTGVFSAATTSMRRRLERAMAASTVRVPVFDGPPHDLIRASSLVLAASGTVNIEVALLGAPLLVFYRTSPVNYLLARLVVQLPCVSPVNILLGEAAAPEFIQRIPAGAAADAAAGLLRDGPAAARQRAAFARLRELLRDRDVSRGIARFLIEEALAARANGERGGGCSGTT